jgi:hypothetical protein
MGRETELEKNRKVVTKRIQIGNNEERRKEKLPGE